MASLVSKLPSVQLSLQIINSISSVHTCYDLTTDCAMCGVEYKENVGH